MNYTNELTSCIITLFQSEALYENVQQIQLLLKNPPKMDNSVFIKKYSENWDMYEDKSNRQYFYFNKELKKTTWKPPRPEKPPPDIPNVSILKSSFGFDSINLLLPAINI